MLFVIEDNEGSILRQILLEEQKQLELSMLNEVAVFCDLNNYTYFLAGGTLLGAVRHKGFIPWDDDIDILMPRNDYQEFIKNYKHPYYRVFTYDDESKYSGEWAVLGDTRTLRIGDMKEEGNIYIDIFPIDGIPNSKIEQHILFFLKSILFFLRLSAVKKYGNTGRYTDRDAGFLNIKKHFRNLVKTIMITFFRYTKATRWAAWMNKLAMRYSFGNTNYAGAILGCNGLKEIMPIAVFQGKKKMFFEGKEYWVPNGFDTYLHSLYGKYMKLPPKEKQVAHHLYTFFWKE